MFQLRAKGGRIDPADRIVTRRFNVLHLPQ